MSENDSLTGATQSPWLRESDEAVIINGQQVKRSGMVVMRQDLSSAMAVHSLMPPRWGSDQNN